MIVEQQRQHIRVSYKAPALQCSAGRPASSENSFVFSPNTAAAVLVACIHPPASQHQHSSSSSSWGSTGDDCWMLEVLETAVLYLLSRVVVVACVCFAPQCSLRISAPTVPLRPVVFSWHCAPVAVVGFYGCCCVCGHCQVVTACSICLCMCQLLLSVWPLQSGRRVQQYVCSCVRLSQPSTPSLQH